MYIAHMSSNRLLSCMQNAWLSSQRLFSYWNDGSPSSQYGNFMKFLWNFIEISLNFKPCDRTWNFRTLPSRDIETGNFPSSCVGATTTHYLRKLPVSISLEDGNCGSSALIQSCSFRWDLHLSLYNHYDRATSFYWGPTPQSALLNRSLGGAKPKIRHA